jgi:hypothetical protein
MIGGLARPFAHQPLRWRHVGRVTAAGGRVTGSGFWVFPSTCPWRCRPPMTRRSRLGSRPPPRPLRLRAGPLPLPLGQTVTHRRAADEGVAEEDHGGRADRGTSDRRRSGLDRRRRPRIRVRMPTSWEIGYRSSPDRAQPTLCTLLDQQSPTPPSAHRSGRWRSPAQGRPRPPVSRNARCGSGPPAGRPPPAAGKRARRTRWSRTHRPPTHQRAPRPGAAPHVRRPYVPPAHPVARCA